MAFTRFLFLALALTWVSLTGCSTQEYDGPTVKEFTGRLVQDGKAVSLAGQTAQLELFLVGTKPESFKVPVQADGTFTVGWMPIGKYNATLLRAKATEKGAPRRDPIPGGLTIEDGKTEYVIELGKGFKP